METVVSICWILELALTTFGVALHAFWVTFGVIGSTLMCLGLLRGPWEGPWQLLEGIWEILWSSLDASWSHLEGFWGPFWHSKLVRSGPAWHLICIAENFKNRCFFQGFETLQDAAMAPKWRPGGS